jgi:hypothetical protein
MSYLLAGATSVTPSPKQSAPAKVLEGTSTEIKDMMPKAEGLEAPSI